MPATARIAAKPSTTPVREWLDRLALVVSATEEAARHSSTLVPASASPRPMDIREARQALQLIDSAIRHLDVIRQDLKGAPSAGAPPNKTLSIRSTRRPKLDKFASPE